MESTSELIGGLGLTSARTGDDLREEPDDNVEAVGRACWVAYACVSPQLGNPGSE
jgi:hypothetical protein